MKHHYYWLLVGLLLLARPAHAQWRQALTAGAVTSLWVDYCQLHEQLDAGLGHSYAPLRLFPLTYRNLALANGAEIALNVLAPKKWRPWINAVTIVAHIPGLITASRRVTGLYHPINGRERIIHIGWRFTP